jgi:hypothetical protein
VWKDLDEEHQDIYNQTLQVLVSKLTTAISKIERLIKRKPEGASHIEELQRERSTGVKKWKYALLKECLDGAINDLETWQRMFDPSWFLIMKAASPLIDAELGTPWLGTVPPHSPFGLSRIFCRILATTPQHSTVMEYYLVIYVYSDSMKVILQA